LQLRYFFVIIVYRIKIEGVDYIMNFDLKFFMTIPGLLITGGVLLFIIALIILLVSGKKSKKAPVPAPAVAPAPNAANATMAAQPAMPINNAQSVPDMNAPTVNMAASITDVPAPIAVEPVMAQPVEQPVMAQPVMAQPVEQPVMAQPVMAQPVEQPVMAQPVMAQPVEQPVMTQPVMAQPVIAQPQAQAPVSIYGGVSPIVPEINAAQPEQHQIYGGADPMENTRSMPVVNQPVMAAAPATPIPEVAVQPMPVTADPNQAATIPTINQ
jgi:nicotinate-nucleotide--dimethylbenzimidazole phosphoribosyltransferase